jgi:uncharacterized protein (TIGR03067 family)
MKNIFFICLAFATSLTAVAAEEADDAKALEGIWIPVKAELGGQPMAAAVLKTITLRLNKGDYEVTVTGEAEPDKGTWTVDAGAKPKGMKVTGLKGPNAGKTFPAIYELKTDTLRICYDLSGAKRPTEFKSDAGTQLFLVTYSRKRP